MNFLAVRLEHVDSVAKTNILPGLLVCPRFFHLHRLYFSPRRLNPPPQRACDRPGELLHSAWSPSSNAAFTTSILGNAGLWQTDSESSPLASEPFRRFIIQSGSSSKCVLFFFSPPAARVQIQIYLAEEICRLLSRRVATKEIFTGGKKAFCSDVWHKRLIRSQQDAGSQTAESFSEFIAADCRDGTTCSVQHLLDNRGPTACFVW